MTTLLSAVTSNTTSSVTELGATTGNSFVVSITSSSQFTANVQIQTSPDNLTWTTIKLFELSGYGNFNNSFSAQIASGYYVRAIASNISGTSTAVTLTLTSSTAGPVDDVVYGQSAIPVGIAQSGTIAVNGTITFSVALPQAYAGIWLYLPANAVVGGSAGFYWFTSVAASTSNFQCTNAYTATMGIPYVPTGYANAVGSNSAYTGVTTIKALASVSIPAGSLGSNGTLRAIAVTTNNNSGNNKTTTVGLSTATITQVNTTNTVTSGSYRIANRGSASSNIYNPTFVTPFGVGTTAYTVSAIDTGVATTFAISGTLATATDYIILETFTVEVLNA